MATEDPDRWPYFRDSPDVVVLAPREGETPSDKPPVRIFLGTEEAQYRAERIFFWSIEKFRDPARTYEIHLMKNVAGFDRNGWRTGFTKYRFAIPDFAGGHGRAIYNDVDQIYLADPALLFDLDMGSHGYLAISAEETSVMLIDCERMRPLWNRDTANREGKHALIKKPAQTPGLWGPCDPHWNARDLEYVEGLTKCLHYTALHQQPWHPFPGDYSYHPNPLAYIWYGLEREADAAGYQVFGRDHPSPDFDRRVAANRDLPPAPQLAEAASAFVRETAPASTLLASVGPSALQIDAERLDLATGAWPDRAFDLVVASELLDRIPPADIPWVVGELFARAGKAVLLRAPATAASGFGSAEWWQTRLDELARAHPAVSWHLDLVPAGEGLAAAGVTTRRDEAAEPPLVWALLDGEHAHEAQALSLARSLGWPFETRRLRFNGKAALPSLVLGASLASLDAAASARLEAPWPDLVIACGARSVPVARWLRQQSGGKARLVQLGQPHASFDLFDLIVTTPQDRLPIRPNVLHVAAPLLAPAPAGDGSTATDLPRPWTALLVPDDAYGYVLRPETAVKLGKAASVEVQQRGGSLLLGIAGGVSDVVAAALRGSLTCPWRELEAGTMADYERRRDVLASVDATIVAAGDPQLLAEACLAGHPVSLFDLPKWYDSLVVVRPALRVLNLLVGGGKSYRGTPLQQHVLSRMLDEAIAKGLVTRPADLGLLHDGLVARGLATMLGKGHEMAKPKPLDDLPTVVERIRRMMTETRRSVAASR